ncbi:5-oxoprolinase subunit PxpA [Antarcticibacterium sp. 1MA-6-2]|uniref:5-oxoprolinase subunit PxpA n=1 Tax=Antarcticibacterium sp. 1MA-6-2 TaxID=2908210 RepID=UPI001F1FA6D1|nr:5-oxoprolinase subunit PxpA [Antarcticibacterium sp. 1MA-6-2]UJH91231.1 5-oxoprolinase subunit PxpA [Antarcticibacterium sp. 1MA-6-2]
MKYIHLNCDLGEGGEQDGRLMPLISACNIASGGHAGDKETMKRTLALALEYNVQIGAHPSYPDKQNFGRKSMKTSSEELKHSLVSQIGSLKKIAESMGGKLDHVKPHGALYNEAAKDTKIATIVLESILKIDEQMSVYVPQNSVIADLAKGKIQTVTEAFADRNYEDNYQLVSRKKSNAVLTEKEKIFNHLFTMFYEGEIETINGKFLECKADTFCLHSDTQNAVEILEYLHQNFTQKNISIFKK